MGVKLRPLILYNGLEAKQTMVVLTEAEKKNPKWAGLSTARILWIKRKRIRRQRAAVTGTHRSEEVRQNISEGRRRHQREKGIPFSPYFRNAALYDREDGSWGIRLRGKKGHSHARHVYEKFYGEIPKGFVVHHIDGNKKNDRPKNLVALSRQEHITLHWFWKAIEAWEGKKVSGKKVFAVYKEWNERKKK